MSFHLAPHAGPAHENSAAQRKRIASGWIPRYKVGVQIQYRDLRAFCRTRGYKLLAGRSVAAALHEGRLGTGINVMLEGASGEQSIQVIQVRKGKLVLYEDERRTKAFRLGMIRQKTKQVAERAERHARWMKQWDMR